MRLFNKGKEDNKQVFEMVATTKQEIKQEIKQNIIDIKNNDIAMLRQDIENNDITHTKGIKELRDEIEVLKKLIYTRENDLIQITSNENNVNIDGYINFKDICKDIDIPNINQTALKYYLHTKGLYNITINHHRNSYTLNPDFNIIDSEFKDLIHIENNNVVFNNEFINYCDKNKDVILQAINDYSAKQEQYEISKRKLESRNVDNYQEEIGNICGTSKNGNYDGKKWGSLYNIFSEKYKNFENDYSKYKRENTNYNEKLDKEFFPSKLTYVVSIMGEGNFLLKIACDLYVKSK